MKTYLGAKCHILHWFDLCAPQFRAGLLTIKSIKRKSESSQRQKYQTVLCVDKQDFLTDTRQQQNLNWPNWENVLHSNDRLRFKLGEILKKKNLQ